MQMQYGKCNMENAIVFLILPKCNSMPIKQRLTYNSKEICLVPRNVQSNQNFAFIKAIAESLFSLQLSFACYPPLYFDLEKKL